MAAPPGFPLVSNSVIGGPSSFWGALGQAQPLPTNSPWQNFVLNGAGSPEAVAPYAVRPQTGGIQFGRPQPNVQTAFIIQAFITNIILGTKEGLSSHTIASYNDLSVTLSWSLSSSGTVALRAPLVWGSPYLTFIFTQPCTPVFTTIHAVLGFSANPSNNKFRVTFNNGQTWLIYTSAPLQLQNNLAATAPFVGTIRFAVLPGYNTSAEENVLDAYATTYPLGGTATLGNYQVSYQWSVASWTSPGFTSPNASNQLLMLSLPMHRRLQVTPSTKLSLPVPLVLRYSTLDGPAVGLAGSSWSMTVDQLPTPWYSPNGINASANELASLKAAVTSDVANLQPPAAADSYFFGKAVARAARLAMIAQELGMAAQVSSAAQVVDKSLSPWFQGTASGDSLVYDPKWGGIVTSNGAKDTGADFGNGLYNDHHYHWGYFLYASAVLAKLNATWGAKYRTQIYGLVRDIMSPQRDSYFPRLRHFDCYNLHSWASGLVEFGDGRNQESTSEAVNAYYSTALVGLVFNDSATAQLGATLAAIESIATEVLWHIPDTNPTLIYSAPFSTSNRLLGVLWSFKRDTGLWFAPASYLEMRTGIQVLPVTPYTRNIFRKKVFLRQLVSWTAQVFSDARVSDDWRAWTWALQSLYNRSSALQNVLKLKSFDGGNSLSNMLWHVLSS